MIFSLIHPSRSRPEQAYRTSQKWLNSASGEHLIEYIVSVDTTDKDLDRYSELFKSPQYGIICRNNSCVVEAANEGAKIAEGEILILVSDDFDCFPNWDIAIADAVRDRSCYVLKTYDTLQKWIVTLPIMDKEYYKLMGYFYHPHYRHMFCDSDMTHVADLQGSLIMRNDIVFQHNHYVTGKVSKDAVNIKADLTWNDGEAIYLNRVKNKFGLNVEDVFNVRPEAKSHLNWLRSKLK